MSDREPLSGDELAEIEDRARKASPGPWQSFIEGRDHWGGDNFIRVGSLDDEADMYVSQAVGSGLLTAGDSDLNFIAYARDDAPRLIAEIRRLRS